MRSPSLTLSIFAIIALTQCALSAPAADPQVTVTVVPVPYAAKPSPYPQPTTNEFLYVNYDEKDNEDKGDRYIVHSAFVPFSSVMAEAVSAVANSNDDTFDRWFPPNVKQGEGKPSVDARGYVSNVYRQIYQPGSNSAPAAGIKTLVHDNKDFNSACKPATEAYMVGSTGHFHVCKPKGLLNKPMIAAPSNCSNLGVSVSKAMESVSSVLIHEFMHWNQVGEKVPNSVGHITDVVYGAATCHRLRLGGENQKTFINADSYMYMAINAYYNSVCNKKFTDPAVTTQDFEDSQQQLQDSPEWEANPGISDGVLAGV